MTVGDGFSGLGRTLHTWDADVDRVVQRIFNRFNAVSVNTYVCHPFCGWERRSLDVWGDGGRGDALPALKAARILDWLFELPGTPFLRHTILEHTLWVRGKGNLPWLRDDHSGPLRHVHATYLPVPPLR